MTPMESILGHYKEVIKEAPWDYGITARELMEEFLGGKEFGHGYPDNTFGSWSCVPGLEDGSIPEAGDAPSSSWEEISGHPRYSVDFCGTKCEVSRIKVPEDGIIWLARLWDCKKSRPVRDSQCWSLDLDRAIYYAWSKMA